MQHQTGVAILILAMLASGLVLILTYGQHLLRYHYNRSYIPQVLMDDIIAAGHNESKSRSVLAVAIRRYLTIVTSVLFIIPSLTVVWGYGLNCTVPTSAEPFSRNIVQLASNEDLSSLQYLKENEWCTLDDQQKLHVLQIIADIEAARMCIEPVTVIDKHMTDNSRGSYRCADRKIYIDLRQHAEYSPDVYVNTVLHECRHAYQCDSVASLNWNNPDVLNGIYFAQARLWRYEQNNYIRAENDPVTYYNQSIEKDARYYAQDTIDLYFSLIESTPQPEIYTTPASFGYSAD